MKSYNLFLLLLISIVPLFAINLALPSKSHAIVMIAPVILIPLVKILAVLFAGLAVPSATIAALYAKLFKKSMKRAVLSAFIILIILLLITGVIIKIAFPETPILRPLY